MGEKFQTPSPLKVHNRFTPENSRILLERVHTKVIQIIATFQISDFWQLYFSFRLTRDNMGGNLSKDISSESVPTRFTPQNSRILLRRVSTNFKVVRIVKFET